MNIIHGTMVRSSTPSAATNKKTTQKPKRPLSAYNLFYRFKRTKILAAHNSGDDSKDTINRLISAVPGLEEYPHLSMNDPTKSKQVINELSRNEIRSALLTNLSPNTRSRSHRKSHGAMSFLEMNKIMVTSWKSIEDVTRKVFEELAEEGRRMYRKRVAEYEDEYGGVGTSSSSSSANAASASSSLSPPRKKVKATGIASKKVNQAKKIRVVAKQEKESLVNKPAVMTTKIGVVEKQESPASTVITPEEKLRLRVLQISKESSSVTEKKKPSRSSSRNIGPTKIHTVVEKQEVSPTVKSAMLTKSAASTMTPEEKLRLRVLHLCTKSCVTKRPSSSPISKEIVNEQHTPNTTPSIHMEHKDFPPVPVSPTTNPFANVGISTNPCSSATAMSFDDIPLDFENGPDPINELFVSSKNIVQDHHHTTTEILPSIENPMMNITPINLLDETTITPFDELDLDFEAGPIDDADDNGLLSTFADIFGLDDDYSNHHYSSISEEDAFMVHMD